MLLYFSCYAPYVRNLNALHSLTAGARGIEILFWPINSKKFPRNHIRVKASCYEKSPAVLDTW